MSEFNVFNSIPVTKPDSSYFDMSHDLKTTFNMGTLVPILNQEVLPGDKWQLQSEAMIRLQPMVAPMMHKADIYIHHFFVPTRILWKDWENFISPPRIATTPPLKPRFNDSNPIQSFEGSLANYMGLPPGSYNNYLSDDNFIDTLPFAAYQRIWWDYYRDQNLQNYGFDTFEDWLGLTNGPVTDDCVDKLLAIRQRAWEHDYFTSCLPFAQKGQAVTVPIEISVGIDMPVTVNPTPPNSVLLKDTTGAAYTVSGNLQANTNVDGPDGTDLIFDPNGTLKVIGYTSDISSSTTVNELRAAYKLQTYLEKNARGGTRYIETLKVHFGVSSSDSRLQRAEYLGGSKSTISISEVLQTSNSSPLSTPQANMAGHGISLVSSNYCDYYAEEHGFIISLISVRPKTSYYQGLPKIFTRQEKLDYYWPEFAHIGEEPVKNKELFLNLTPATMPLNEQTFGYLPRYSEYRYIPSRVTGFIQSMLEYWSMHRKFALQPVLNEAFIMCDATTRIFAVDPTITNTHSCIAHIYHQVGASRKLPKYGEPLGL